MENDIVWLQILFLLFFSILCLGFYIIAGYYKFQCFLLFYYNIVLASFELSLSFNLPLWCRQGRKCFSIMRL